MYERHESDHQLGEAEGGRSYQLAVRVPSGRRHRNYCLELVERPWGMEVCCEMPAAC